MRFPEDDEITPEEAQEELSSNDRMMRDIDERNHYLKKRARQPQLDPKDAKLVELAQNAGHALGANEALGNRIVLLERRISVRDEELERLNDRDAWKARAEAAEATIARSKKLKRRK